MTKEITQTERIEALLGLTEQMLALFEDLDKKPQNLSPDVLSAIEGQRQDLLQDFSTEQIPIEHRAIALAQLQQLVDLDKALKEKVAGVKDETFMTLKRLRSLDQFQKIVKEQRK